MNSVACLLSSHARLQEDPVSGELFEAQAGGHQVGRKKWLAMLAMQGLDGRA